MTRTNSGGDLDSEFGHLLAHLKQRTDRTPLMQLGDELFPFPEVGYSRFRRP